jgi:hypothetical protein
MTMAVAIKAAVVAAACRVLVAVLVRMFGINGTGLLLMLWVALSDRMRGVALFVGRIVGLCCSIELCAFSLRVVSVVGVAALPLVLLPVLAAIAFVACF